MNYQGKVEKRFYSPDYMSRSGSDADRPAKASIYDRVFALAIVVLASPFLTILSLLIFLGGRRPIFLQERVGYKGKTFCIYKFRTMPDEGWDVARETAKSSALARGQLAIFSYVSVMLRKTGLDELPQFVNILKSDMQVIGPRPLMKADFMALPERRLERCNVLPGITGLAQINGGQELDSESKLALDLYLIKKPSLGVSGKIVTRTILRILGFASATATISDMDLELARRSLKGGNSATPAVGNENRRPIQVHKNAAMVRTRAF